MAGLVLTSLGCSNEGEAEACDDLRRTYHERLAVAEEGLDELLAYRQSVSLHDRTQHDLQFDYAKAMVAREAAREARDDAGCEPD